MGLDMYFAVERSFHPDSAETRRILSHAQVTADELRTMASLDPYEHETDIYLPCWDFYEGDKKAKSEAVLRSAGLLPLMTNDNPSGRLRWLNAQVAVAVTAIYWRKANSVHSWFVQNCQNGVDECQESVVHPEMLALLRSTCADAVAAFDGGDLDAAESIMTPESGFFFGSTDADEWWKADMVHTIAEIDRVVSYAATLRGGVEFFYRSSW